MLFRSIETEREMNEAEFAQYQIDLTKETEREMNEAQIQANRLALLNRLGITEDEAKLLLS